MRRIFRPIFGAQSVFNFLCMGLEQFKNIILVARKRPENPLSWPEVLSWPDLNPTHQPFDQVVILTKVSCFLQIILSWLRAMELASAYAVAKQRR